MAKRYVYTGSEFKELGGEGDGEGGGLPFPSVPTNDTVDTSNSVRTVVSLTGSASPNNFSTPGAWVEVASSLSADCNAMSYMFNTATFINNLDTSTLVQIGTGSSGSETPHVTFSVGQSGQNMLPMVPVSLTAGQRVSMRVLSAAQSSMSVQIVVTFHEGSELALPQSIGFDPANAQGVAQAGTTINVKTGWEQLTASCPEDIDVIAVFIQPGGDLSGGGNQLVDIGYGSSGNEVVLLPNLATNFTANEFVVKNSPMTYALNQTIPAGTRLVFRWARSGNAMSVMDVGVVTARRA